MRGVLGICCLVVVELMLEAGQCRLVPVRLPHNIAAKCLLLMYMWQDENPSDIAGLLSRCSTGVEEHFFIGQAL